MLETLNMGGYAIFVWSAYAIAMGLTFFLYRRSVKQLKHAEKQAKELGLITEKVKTEEVSLEKQSV
jgi:heme exporter protein D